MTYWLDELMTKAWLCSVHRNSTVLCWNWLTSDHQPTFLDVCRKSNISSKVFWSTSMSSKEYLELLAGFWGVGSGGRHTLPLLHVYMWTSHWHYYFAWKFYFLTRFLFLLEVGWSVIWLVKVRHCRAKSRLCNIFFHVDSEEISSNYIRVNFYVPN